MTGSLAGRRVVVAGLGMSGAAAARVLLDRGAKVIGVDERDAGRLGGLVDKLRTRGVALRLGDAAAHELPAGADLVVTSPGWRPDHPLLLAAKRAGVEVIGEPELAWRLRPSGAADWLGVTGTNGKTTTVGMLASVLTAAGLHTAAAGNIGRPLVEVVTGEARHDVLAVELSSFQLHWSRSVQCSAASVLNVADDHTDWHGSFASYAEDKARIIGTETVAVVNLDDAGSRAASAAATRTVGFTVGEPGAEGYGVRADRLVGPGGTVLAEVADVHPPGPHNLANALAAAALAGTRGIEPAAVAAGLRAYSPGPHRNEVVVSAGGVSWVDDSKATNPHAAAASLAAYSSVVWIAGGLLKGADVDELVAAQASRLRAVVLIGRDREEFAAALARHAPDVPVVTVETDDTGGMEDAVHAAAAAAHAGDTVLLAPAAASMDMFRDYADRGERFAAAARRVAATLS